MKIIKRIIILLIIYFSVCIPASANNQIKGVVKIIVTSNGMNYYMPWQSHGIRASAGSGIVIEGNKILTNAHVVTDNTFVRVKKENDPKKYTARVLNIGHDCDLAILTVDDPSFFNEIKPVSLGQLPKLQDSVTVIGYPQGGDKISITEGVVSRIEVTSYAQSTRQLLTVQIDAAINPGNSGGPILMDGKLVGIAMQSLQSGQNIGYIIPVPIIKHFFDDLNDTKYDGFPIMGIEYDSTENESVRQYFGIQKQEGGILVTRVLPHSPADGFLLEGDVVLSINGINIAEDGTYKFLNEERLSLTHIISQEQINNDLKLKIVRDKKIKKISFPLQSFTSIVPQPHAFEKPPYYIYGGCVFSVLSTDLLKSWGNRFWESAPLDFNYFLFGRGRLNFDERQEIVVLLNVFPDDINVAYQRNTNEVVSQVNGKTFNSFKEFVQLIESAKKTDKYTSIKTEQNALMVLKNKDIDIIDKKIMDRNSIPFQYSEDVLKWVQSKK